jgi:O-antigen/teichoic acid export membrane protein
MRVSVRLATFAVTVSAALILQNHWALVIGMVLQSSSNAAASYIFHPYRPRFSLARRSEILSVSLWMFLASASQTIHAQVERIVVGRVSARAALGFYSVSKDLSAIFTEEIATALNRVTFVTTAQTGRPLSADPGRLSAMLGAYALIAAPLGLGLAATADQALPVLLGPQWTHAVPFLAIIAPACALYAVYKLVISTLQASGDARAAAFLSVAGAGLMVASTATVALAGHDARAVAASALVSTGLLLAAGVALLARKAATSAPNLLMSVARPFGAACLMMIVLRNVDTEGLWPVVALVLKISVGATLFAIAVPALWIAQGRPAGAEKILFALVSQRLERLISRSAQI